MTRIRDQRLASQSEGPILIGANEVLRVPTGLIIDGESVNPHFVDIASDCPFLQILETSEEGWFEIWNPTLVEVAFSWKAHHLHSEESEPIPTVEDSSDPSPDPAPASVCTLPPGAIELSFLDLTDTPASYAGSAGFGVRVNVGEDGLEFFDLASVIEGIKYSWPDAAGRAAQTGMVDGELGVQRDTGDVYKYNDPPGAWSVFFNLQDGFFATATRGDILRRGAAGWEAYSPGAIGTVLTSQGALSDPVWAALAPSPTSLDGVYLVNAVSSTPYATIGAALAAAVAGEVVYVGPGSYAESVLIPAGVSLIAPYGPDSTIIVGAAPGGARVILSNGSFLKGFSINCPNDATAGILDSNTTQAFVRDCKFFGGGAAGFGIAKTGAGQGDYRDLQYMGGSCDVVFDMRAGFAVFWNSMVHPSAVAAINAAWKIENSFVGLSSCGSFSPGATDGIQVGANGSLLCGNVEIGNCVNGLNVTSGSASLNIRSTRIETTTTWDILVAGGASGALVHLLGSELDRDKVSRPYPMAQWIAFFQDERVQDEGMVCQGELSVGEAGQGRESVFGEGQSYILGMAVLRNTNQTAGAWSDITAAMVSKLGSTAALFAGNGVNQSLFIGSDYPFPAFQVDITTAALLGSGALDVSYWDGAAWSAIDVMAADKNGNYQQYGDTIFERVNTEHIRFSDIPLTGGSAWSTLALNGITKYWIKISINTASITTIPVAEYMQIHANTTEINKDGVQEFFGKAEPLRDLLVHLNLVDDLDGASPGDEKLFLTTNIAITPKDNRFEDGDLDGNGETIQIPEGLDTSKDLTLELDWIPLGAVAGDVELEKYHGGVKLGDTLDGTLGDILQSQIISLVAGDLNVLRRTSFSFRVSTLVPGDLIALSYFRDAQPANLDDTYGEDVGIVAVRLFGSFWR